jgi:hypothetical protein
MREPEILVKRRCKHGDLHPHNGSTLEEGRFYCTEGDSAVLKGPELQARIFAELAEKHPRMTIDDASKKAAQLVDMFFGMLREGTVEYK